MIVKSRKLVQPLESCFGLNCSSSCIALACCVSLSSLVFSVSEMMRISSMYHLYYSICLDSMWCNMWVLSRSFKNISAIVP